jgi:hypothetical protein
VQKIHWSPPIRLLRAGRAGVFAPSLTVELGRPNRNAPHKLHEVFCARNLFLSDIRAKDNRAFRLHAGSGINRNKIA